MNDGCDTETRQNAENFWIHQLVTMHPFGLNDKVTGMKGFIAGASAAVSKPLNITIVRILEVVKNNTVKYCDTIRERSGCNLYWSVNSSSQTNSMLQDMSTTAENDHLANDEQEVTTAPGNGNAE
ncbi:hypothetical protein DdX_14138 [Ditylenchus destructor]|uniref:Uncharacterized protein n=1 Tax=Ditylenchus destructor TaxID=166010 RepID=A0AAD4MSE0_9BILA|nr:hypothetical protein DdX_14138 [Ditylenchus destructor]